MAPKPPSSGNREAKGSRKPHDAPLGGLRSNVTVRSGRKRSYSASAIEDATRTAAEHASSFSPDTPAPAQPRPRRQIADLALVVNSLSRLGPGAWLDDVVMAVISHRIASPDMGVVNSLMLASKYNTSCSRLLLGPVMSKRQTLIFMNSQQNWVVFLWTHETRTHIEYSSLPSSSSDKPCAGGDVVPDFLKWVYSMPDLRIKVTSGKCSTQTNSFDSGIYALNFAKAIA
ncbi:hypothetical protein LZ30DRAFT_787658 [Colletotrichum cereale]|nr:hypothetical protein LZ30DRAFT_787658 [Colletotrichum cereale]